MAERNLGHQSGSVDPGQLPDALEQWFIDIRGGIDLREAVGRDIEVGDDDVVGAEAQRGMTQRI
jgi:hypothetical protein